MLNCVVYKSIVCVLMGGSCLRCRKKARRESEEQFYVGSKASSLLSSEMEELSGVVYRPRTKETRASYELLLSFIQNSIGDQVCVSIGSK